MSAPEVGPEAVVAFVPDLMDRSKVRARFPGATLVPTAAKLAEAAGLGGTEGPRTVGFASHVDETTLTAARDVGVEALPRSVFFRRLGQGGGPGAAGHEAEVAGAV